MLDDVLFWTFENWPVVAGAVVLVAIIGILLRKRVQAPTAKPQVPDVRLANSEERIAAAPPVAASGGMPTAPTAKPASVGDGPFRPAHDRDQAMQLLNLLVGDIPRRKVSPLYLVGMFLVAICMVVLPLVYLGLVSGVIYGVYWYATHYSHILDDPTYGTRSKLFLYFAPLLAGSVTAFFLLKPLLARRARPEAPVSVTREEEPVLFAFVESLCRRLGAPLPNRIDVDCRANASASLRRGFWSLFLPGDLVLTIGLPLVGGMDLRSFAGILAHEFGHFSQGAAMRLGQVIWMVNSWFARVVYQRDTWDEALVKVGEGLPIQLSPIIWIAQIAVFLSRRILWLLMTLAHTLSSFLSRQQEFDADRYEAFLVGSNTFERTFRALLEIAIATDIAHEDLERGLRKLGLPQNFPELCLHNVPKVPGYVLGEAWSAARHAPTGLLDTHPSTGQRIAAVEKLDEPGVFHPPAAPAFVLFRNFEKSCEKATLAYFRQVIGNGIGREQLLPNAAFMDQLERTPGTIR